MTELLDLDLSEISLIEREPQYLATVQTSPEKSLEEEIELILEQTKKYQLRVCTRLPTAPCSGGKPSGPEV